MNLSKFKITNKGLYWGLIITFMILYACVGFVSTLHSITFFQLANNLGLAILLGLTYEVGQASVLFSILMSEKNKAKFLPWALMVLLTALQVTANVYASFKFMAGSGSTDWTYWQKSILFGVQASSPEMYQVIISWISGALLPIVALGMTALVAQNMNFMKEENEKKESIPADQADEIINNEVERKVEQILKPEVVISDPKPDQTLVYKDDSFVNTDVDKSNENNDLDEEVERLSPESILVVQPPQLESKSDLIYEPPKKRGRPPKEKDVSVVEPKKEQEPLLNEEVKVPKKPKRFVDPLKLKGKKIKPAKNLKEFHKPSTGDQIIQIIKNIDKEKDKESIIEETSVKAEASEPIETKPEDGFASYIVNGVEVVDVKAIQKAEKKN